MLISFILSSRRAESESCLQGRQRCAAPFSTVNKVLQWITEAFCLVLTIKLLLSLMLLVKVAIVFVFNAREQRQKLVGELINRIWRLSIYCVKFWNSMEKSWHHFQPIPRQEVYSFSSRQFYPPLLKSHSQTLCSKASPWHHFLKSFRHDSAVFIHCCIK